MVTQNPNCMIHQQCVSFRKIADTFNGLCRYVPNTHHVRPYKGELGFSRNFMVDSGTYSLGCVPLRDHLQASSCLFRSQFCMSRMTLIIVMQNPNRMIHQHCFAFRKIADTFVRSRIRS
jgi:hypothetical protein